MNHRIITPGFRLDDWDDLRYFLAIARAGSLNEAANALEVNPSTVYRRIRQCESQLGVQLFERSTQGHELTPAGEAMLEFVEHTDNGLGALLNRLQGEDIRLSGSIHVTSTDVIAQTLFIPALADFKALYPGIDIHLSIDSQRYDLTRREADVALRPTIQPPPHLSGVCLCEEPWRIYGATGHSVPQSLDELKQAKIITGDGDIGAIPAMRWFHDQVDATQIMMRCNSAAMILETIVATGAVGLLPQLVGDADPRLTRTPLCADAPPLQVWLLTHPEIRRAERIRALFDFLLERYGNHTEEQARVARA